MSSLGDKQTRQTRRKEEDGKDLVDGKKRVLEDCLLCSKEPETSDVSVVTRGGF